MTDLDPSAVMAAHANEQDPMYRWWYCPACGKASLPDRCEPYRLAEVLVAAQEDVDRLSAYSAAAFDQRDAAQDALAGSEAKVARVQSLADQWRAADLVRVSQIDTALADQPGQAS